MPGVVGVVEAQELLLESLVGLDERKTAGHHEIYCMVCNVILAANDVLAK